jgi:hypothetical protein
MTGRDRTPASRPDGGHAVVALSDRDRLRRELERFGDEAFVRRDDGTLACDFAGVTHFTVLADGRVDAGMPRHAFEGKPDRLVFDHERGEVTVEIDREGRPVSYTFRRP